MFRIQRDKSFFCVYHGNVHCFKTNPSSIWFYLHHQAHLWGIILVLVGLSTITITHIRLEQYSILMHSTTKVIFFLFKDTNNLFVPTMSFYLKANHSNIRFYLVVNYEAQMWDSIRSSFYHHNYA